MFTIEQLYQKLSQLTERFNFCVAYSGGLDSHVLLHSLSTLAQHHPKIKLRAIHINHGLSPNSTHWAQHCQRVSLELGIACVIKSVVVTHIKKSPEAAARDARYSALVEMLQNDEILLTAHTCNDQAETVLLQLLRGAGPKGLAAMPSKMEFANTYLIRPLLEFDRAQLQAYATQHQLQWVEDESNDHRRFDRNYLRHEILPGLRQRWPAVLHTVSRSAEHCAETSFLLNELAEQDWQQTKGSVVNTLYLPALLTLNAARQRNLLRHWLERLNLPLPSRIKLRQLQRDVLQSRPDANPKITWPGAEVRRFRQLIYALPPLHSHDPRLNIPWNLQDRLELPNHLGILHAHKIKGQGFYLPEFETVQVRFRQGGEMLHPKGRQGSHPLKKLYQEWQVPTWQRDRTPLLYLNDELIAVTGRAVASHYVANEEQWGYVIMQEETASQN